METPTVVRGQGLAQPDQPVRAVDLHAVYFPVPGGIAGVDEQGTEQRVPIGEAVAHLVRAVEHAVVVEVVGGEPGPAVRRTPQYIDPGQRLAGSIRTARHLPAVPIRRPETEGRRAPGRRSGSRSAIFAYRDVAEHKHVVRGIPGIRTHLDGGDVRTVHVGARGIHDHQLVLVRDVDRIARPGAVVDEVMVDLPGAGVRDTRRAERCARSR